VDNVVRHLRVLWRAESIIADIRLHVLAARSRLVSLAGLIAVFGLVMLNVAGYLALGQLWGQAWAAVAMAGIDFVIAGLLVFVAIQSKPGRDLELAHEVRDMALSTLENDVSAVQAELVALRNDFRDARSNLTRFVKHPLDAALPALIGPLGSILLQSLKKRREGN